MWVWIWVSSPTHRGGEPEAVDGPVQVLVPAVAAQRQALAQRGLVDLDDRDARGLQVRDLVADRQRELLAGLGSAAGRRGRTTSASIVTGPVSMPLTGRFGQRLRVGRSSRPSSARAG